MAFYYFAWKNGIKAEKKKLQEWDELSQEQYLQICAKNKKVDLEDRRFFEKVSGIEQGDDTYYFECNIDAYRRYRRKKEKEAYKEKEEAKDADLYGEITLISLDAPYEDSNGDSYSLHDIVADENSAFEDRLIHSLDLNKAMQDLTSEEKELVKAIFWADEPMTVREYAKEQKLPFTTVQSRKKKILRKMKKSFVQN